MRSITLHVIPTQEPCETYVLPLSGFPLHEEEERLEVDNLLSAFCDAAARHFTATSEVFLQLEQLHGKECRKVVADNGRHWMPETGLGVWVDREPPQKWTKEELDNFVPGTKFRPLMFQVFRISSDSHRRKEARSAMLRFGSVLEILTPDGEQYLPKIKPAFLETITDQSYTCFPFYVPLIEAKTMENATSDNLIRWFNGVTVYIRQSFEDKGILIASSKPLAPVLHALGGTLKNGSWNIAI
jgi:hypothetical protein